MGEEVLGPLFLNFLAPPLVQFASNLVFEKKGFSILFANSFSVQLPPKMHEITSLAN